MHDPTLYDGLPYDRVLWQDQGEIPLAFPVAMLFGRMHKKHADIWIYLAKTTPSIIFHSYYLDGRPDGYQIVDEALQKANPNPAFKLATTPMKLLALATHYFIKKGLADKYELRLTAEQEEVLRSMCGNGAQQQAESQRVRRFGGISVSFILTSVSRIIMYVPAPRKTPPSMPHQLRQQPPR
jgi:hypothetical protein